VGNVVQTQITNTHKKCVKYFLYVTKYEHGDGVETLKGQVSHFLPRTVSLSKDIYVLY
jgi:hypothetical protein